MLSREPAGRNLPTLITLVVLGIMLMTFDVRSEGAGVVGVLRAGTQTIVAPLQKAASYAVTPVVNLVTSLSNVATLREENQALRRELVEMQARLNTTRDLEVRLDLFEKIHGMDPAGSDIRQTVANVIGRVGITVDEALIIDRGTSHGIAVGQPVVDPQFNIVGSVRTVTATSATVVPIMSSRQGVTVIVGDQEGTLLSQAGNDLMRLEIYRAQEPVLIGEPVRTSAASILFPAGWLVGEVVQDAAPVVDVLTTWVRPFVNPQTLRLVVVLAWPPDPITAITDPVPASTTTTVPGDSSTTTEADS